jgi:hypothetical protein
MRIGSIQRGRGLNLSARLPIIIIILLMPQVLLAAQFSVLQRPGIRVQYESPLKGLAQEVVESYPDIKMSLEKTFGWEIAFRPTVVLIQDRQLFQQQAGTAPIVGYAVPGDHLIVIDCSRLHIRPHRLDNVLKHEMVHLILHHHIRGGRLPRWLDEGVAQRISDGIAELLVVPRRSVHTVFRLKKSISYWPMSKVAVSSTLSSRNMVKTHCLKFSNTSKTAVTCIKRLPQAWKPRRKRSKHDGFGISKNGRPGLRIWRPTFMNFFFLWERF